MTELENLIIRLCSWLKAYLNITVEPGLVELWRGLTLPTGMGLKSTKDSGKFLHNQQSSQPSHPLHSPLPVKTVSLVVMAGPITVTLIGWSSCDVSCCLESFFLFSNWGCYDCRADHMKSYFLGHYLILLFSALSLSPLLSDFCPLQMTLRFFKTRMSKRNSASRTQKDRRGPEIALLSLGMAVHWSSYRSLRIVFPTSGAGSRYTLIFIKKCCCILWDL